ncbi:hypothetical protein [Hoeflea sp. TYP-13]|uniref:hypothetical protein n=1 Tax=Hoeflea sp. TYP-13 TaxID=3230023 RepID=UPI0034C6B4B7
MAGDDIIDAEFELVEDDAAPRPPKPDIRTKSYVPTDDRAPDFSGAKTGGADRLDLFSDKKSGKKRALRLSPAGFTAAIAVLSLCVFWFSGGYALAPGLFGGSSGKGLSLSRVTIDPVRVNDGSYFVVHGLIKNDSADDRDVPLLAIGPGPVSGEQMPLYARAGKKRLAAGESTRFQVRVPNQIRDYDQLTVTLAGGGTAR